MKHEACFYAPLVRTTVGRRNNLTARNGQRLEVPVRWMAVGHFSPAGKLRGNIVVFSLT